MAHQQAARLPTGPAKTYAIQAGIDPVAPPA